MCNFTRIKYCQYLKVILFVLSLLFLCLCVNITCYAEETVSVPKTEFQQLKTILTVQENQLTMLSASNKKSLMELKMLREEIVNSQKTIEKSKEILVEQSQELIELKKTSKQTESELLIAKERLNEANESLKELSKAIKKERTKLKVQRCIAYGVAGLALSMLVANSI